MKRRILLCTIFLFVTCCVANADVIFEQSPIAIGNPHVGSIGASSTLPENTAGQENISRAYDNFVITEPTTISGITWNGSYNGEFNPNEDFRGIADFRIEFFSNSTSNGPNVSDSLGLFELDGGTAGRNDGTDLTSSIVPDQMSSGVGGGSQTPGIVETYDAELSPFVLEPGTYWLAIQARQSFPSPFPDQNPLDPNRHFDPLWSWTLSDDPDGDNRLYSFDTQFGDRFEPGIVVNGQGDLTFSLIGESVSTDPDGDFNGDGLLDAEDIDLLTDGIRTCRRNCDSFDLNQDGVADEADLTFWVEEIKQTLPGDANLDGIVQFIDFLALSRNFSMEGGWTDGNFNTDTLVGFPDFLILSRNFGLSASDVNAAASGEAAAVPEPSSAILCLLGCIVLLTRRSRQR